MKATLGRNLTALASQVKDQNLCCIIHHPIGTWKWNFQPYKKIMTDRPTNQRTDMRDHREVTLPITLYKVVLANIGFYKCIWQAISFTHSFSPREICSQTQTYTNTHTQTFKHTQTYKHAIKHTHAHVSIYTFIYRVFRKNCVFSQFSAAPLSPSSL